MAGETPSLLTRRGRAQHGRRARQRYSVRAFWLTFLIFSFLALCSWWAAERRSSIGQQRHSFLRARDINAFSSEDEQCRLVHKAHDQCAFAHKNCPDEEPGFLAYLNLYYCRLGHVKPVAFIILVSWLGLLFSTIGIAASDFFCVNLSTIATILGMSESMAGVTFLAFGNGSPDVFSTFAAMSTNSSSLAIGELMGAAGFITAVVAGSMALVRPFKVAKKSFIRDVGFFVVAAGFSMGFLSDGRLHLWECALMVGYYIFYVVFVCLWHWWITRRMRRRQKEAAARGHFVVPDSEELAVQEEYHDGDEEEAGSRPPVSRGVSTEDFRSLEDGGVPQINRPDDDEDEEARDRWLGELSSNMRLRRPVGGRRNTMNPIRPSLVGALEFQAVLNSLQRSRNIQTMPMHLRRYSDEPTYTSAQQQDHMSDDHPASRPPFAGAGSTGNADPEVQRPSLDGPGRPRAVSANDAANFRPDSSLLKSHARPSQNLIDIAEDDNDNPDSAKSVPTAGDTPAVVSAQDRSPDLLAPPAADMPAGFRHYRPTEEAKYQESPHHSPRTRPRLGLRGSSQGKPTRRSPLSSDISSPVPSYRDDPSAHSSGPPSLHLPPATISVESETITQSEEDHMPENAPSWWPSRRLPPPMVMVTTLFPTLLNWRSKSWWEKTLGVVATPSVFLLTITLPVVEADKNEDEEVQTDTYATSTQTNENDRSKSVTALAADSPESIANDTPYERRASAMPQTAGNVGIGAAAVAVDAEQENHGNEAGDTAVVSANESRRVAPTHPHTQSSPKLWNRWLTIVQLFLAPFMVVLVVYTQFVPPEGDFWRTILRPILIAHLTSLILLVPLLLTTTPTYRPKIYQTILSLAGFVVSIAWISTIASQVVAILKTFAIILNMSHAILGLTVFAVGNSLGDLVADVTVARLGYPVMALSACFGGPMLNILLGIGLSGCWILIRGAEKRQAKHPGKGGLHFKTYEIEVGDTLIVSGVTLLITLVGLLIAVPLNNWMMTRRIAWALIALWCTGTVVNVVLEIWLVGNSSAGE